MEIKSIGEKKYNYIFPEHSLTGIHLKVEGLYSLWKRTYQFNESLVTDSICVPLQYEKYEGASQCTFGLDFSQGKDLSGCVEKSYPFLTRKVPSKSINCRHALGNLSQTPVDDDDDDANFK